MNRRDLFKSIAGAAAAGGVVADRVSAVPAEPEPVFAVLEASGGISDHTINEEFARRVSDAVTNQMRACGMRGYL